MTVELLECRVLFYSVAATYHMALIHVHVGNDDEQTLIICEKGLYIPVQCTVYMSTVEPI